jgi:hypothetical protein
MPGNLRNILHVDTKNKKDETPNHGTVCNIENPERGMTFTFNNGAPTLSPWPRRWRIQLDGAPLVEDPATSDTFPLTHHIHHRDPLDHELFLDNVLAIRSSRDAPHRRLHLDDVSMVANYRAPHQSGGWGTTESSLTEEDVGRCWHHWTLDSAWPALVAAVWASSGKACGGASHVGKPSHVLPAKMLYRGMLEIEDTSSSWQADKVGVVREGANRLIDHTTTQ